MGFFLNITSPDRAAKTNTNNIPSLPGIKEAPSSAGPCCRRGRQEPHAASRRETRAQSPGERHGPSSPAHSSPTEGRAGSAPLPYERGLRTPQAAAGPRCPRATAPASLPPPASPSPQPPSPSLTLGPGRGALPACGAGGAGRSRAGPPRRP